ncbi:MAG: glycine zipper 2TM domain-containing protein [Rudaea sp.]
MKRMLCLLAALAASAPALAGDVGVSVQVGQPGFYGRIDVGSMPPPPTLYAEPIVVTRAPVGVVGEPIYLRVPPGHARHWSKHCHRYGACGRPVYFVQERWYNEVYVPRHAHEYRVVETAPAYEAAPTYAYAERPRPRLYSVPVASVRAVVGPPEQRCWVERRQVVEERGDVNVPGAIAGAVIGGVLGHQIGGGRGRDIATVGGAVAGGAIGANIGRGGQVVSEDLHRCATVQSNAHPEYWDVTYRFRGVVHRAQFSAPPGRTIVVDENGVPRG